MKKLNIAIIGLGNIGIYLYKYLNKNKKIISKKNNCIPNIIYISARNKNRKRDFKINKGDKVLIVEDVITTGKSSIECSKLVTLNNANIVGYACIIDRSNGKSEIKEKIISQVELNIPTYKKDNCNTSRDFPIFAFLKSHY